MRVPPARALLLLLVLHACTSAPAAERSTEPDPEQRIHRIETGLLPLNLLEGEPDPGLRLEERMAFYRTPGVSIAVIREGRLDWARAYGVAEAGGDVPVDTATLFQAASISKPVAAVAALRLVEQGRLALDADVNGTLRGWRVPDNEFTVAQRVTLRRLLSHDAGLTVHGFAGYAAGEPVPTLLQLLDGVEPANSPPVRVDLVPGSRWRYSGGGTSVAQLLMEQVTGTDFPTLMRESVLGPAGMVHSTYEQPLPADRAARAATAHRGDGSPVPGGWHTYPEMAAAGLWTTPSDLARLALAVQAAANGGPSSLLTAATAGEMLTPQSGEFGLGFALAEAGGRRFFMHGGANAGFRAQFVASVDGRDGAVVMTNGDDGQALAMEILRAIAREYGWPLFQPNVRRATTLDPAVLPELAGRYAFEFRGETHTIEIVEHGGGLLAGLPIWDGLRPLYADPDGAFFFRESSAEIAFERDADGRVEALRLTGVGSPFRARRVEP